MCDGQVASGAFLELDLSYRFAEVLKDVKDMCFYCRCSADLWVWFMGMRFGGRFVVGGAP